MPPDGAALAPATGLEVARLEGLAALEPLRREWSELWRESGAGPFQTPACLIPWARVYAADRIAVLTARDRGRLVGLAPVFSWEGRLLLAGTGPTDENDAVIAPDGPEVAAALLAEACALADARGCETVDLHQLGPGTPLLSAQAPAGWRAETSPGDVCPVASLSGVDGLGGLQPGWPRKVRYNQRRCAEAGGTFALAKPEQIAEHAAALQRLHARRWAARGEPGVLHDPLMSAFVEGALPELQAAGVLRMGGVRIGGELAAVLCALADRRGWCFYLTGFDPDHEAVSPGTTLIAAMFTAAAAEGAGEVRFLRGQEPYKYRWGAVDQPSFRRTLRRA